MKKVVLSLFMLAGFTISHAADQVEKSAGAPASADSEVVVDNPLHGKDSKKKKKNAAAPSSSVDTAAPVDTDSKKKKSDGCALL